MFCVLDRFVFSNNNLLCHRINLFLGRLSNKRQSFTSSFIAAPDSSLAQGRGLIRLLHSHFESM